MTYWCPPLILIWFQGILVLIPLWGCGWGELQLSYGYVNDPRGIFTVCHSKSPDSMGNIMHNNSLWLYVTLADGDPVELVCVRVCARTSVWQAGGEWNRRAVYQTHRKWVLLSEDVSHHRILLLGSSFRRASVHTMYSKQQMLARWLFFCVHVFLCVVCGHLILPLRDCTLIVKLW